jgi:hypothetical protein
MSFANQLNSNNFIIKEGLDNLSSSLTDPSNVFILQNKVSDDLNSFQTQYSRYLQCQDSRFASSVNPKCDLAGKDSFQNVTKSYNTLLSSIKETKSAFDSNIKDQTVVNPIKHDLNEEEILIKHHDISELRKQLDLKLEELYNEMDKGAETSIKRLDSTIYANTLWVILASCLVYYVFVHNSN